MHTYIDNKITFFHHDKKKFDITQIPKISQLDKKGQHDPYVRLESKVELGYNQKANHEKFSLSITVTPARAELGLAQL